MSKSFNKLVFIVLFIVTLVFIIAIYYLSTFQVLFAPPLPPSYSVQRGIKLLGNNLYEISITITPLKETGSIVIQDTPSGTILQENYGFQNVQDYHGFIKIEGNTIKAVVLQPFSSAVILKYQIQSSGTPTFSGNYRVPSTNEQGSITGSGSTPETICNDNKDNDNDGKIDCADTDCYSKPCTTSTGASGLCNSVTKQCLAITPPTKEICADGKDNDNDGKIDCADTTDCPAGTTCGIGKMCITGSCIACGGDHQLCCGSVSDPVTIRCPRVSIPSSAYCDSFVTPNLCMPGPAEVA